MVSGLLPNWIDKVVAACWMAQVSMALAVESALEQPTVVATRRAKVDWNGQQVMANALITDRADYGSPWGPWSLARFVCIKWLGHYLENLCTD